MTTSKLKVTGHTGGLTGACGVANISAYRVMNGFTPTQEKNYERLYGTEWKHIVGVGLALGEAPHLAGGDYGFACFIDNDVCKAAYEQLTAAYRLVFQTPIRMNRIHANDKKADGTKYNGFFFCIFDAKKDGELPAIEPKWGFDK